jgi:hypothetical protein
MAFVVDATDTALEVPMKFLLLLHDDSAAVAAHTPDERRAMVEAHIAYAARLRERGALVLGEPIADPDQARTIRFPANGGAPTVTDGPFVEAKEALGGFYVIDCADERDALALAAEVPRSPGLVAEVLPIPEV